MGFVGVRWAEDANTGYRFVAGLINWRQLWSDEITGSSRLTAPH